jgi:hypothetical protein
MGRKGGVALVVDSSTIYFKKFGKIKIIILIAHNNKRKINITRITN